MNEYFMLTILPKNTRTCLILLFLAEIIRQHDATKDEMAILSSSLTDIDGAMDKETGKILNQTRPIICNTHYFGSGDTQHLDRGRQPVVEPTVPGIPELQPFFAGEYNISPYCLNNQENNGK